MFETDLVQAFAKIEGQYRAKGRVFEGKGRGYGELLEDGPEVARIRTITSRLVPPYLRPQDFRVYVIGS